MSTLRGIPPRPAARRQLSLRWLLFATLVFVVTSSELPAGTFDVFGPKNYTRTTTAPQVVTETFTASANGSYTLRLDVGGEDSTFERITSAEVLINGVAVLTPNDFTGKTPDTIEKSVTLAASNTMTVEVRGNPGSGATLRLIGVDNDAPSITASVSPQANAAGWHRATATVSFTCSDAISGIATCPASVVVSDEGTRTVAGTAIDRAGNEMAATVEVKLDKTAPELALSTNGGATNTGTARISGRVDDANGVASVTVGGTAATIISGGFETTVQLPDGASSVAVAATDVAGNVTARTLQFDRFTMPVVTITSPADLSTLRTSVATIQGTVSDPQAAVMVNGVIATVAGNTFTADGIALQQGRTVITAAATSRSGHTGTATAILYRDSIAPRVVVHYPVDGATVYQTPVDVTGMVDDIVVGTINSANMTIRVNGVAAEVANRAFLASVPLTPGSNALAVTATDQGGNTVTVTRHVTYSPNVNQPRIVTVSGSGQRAMIGSALPQPLVVKLLNAAGAPVANQLVAFEVAENNGTLSAGGTGERSVSLRTDAQGQASVVWTLGTRAGAGNNRVLATAGGFTGVVQFTAVATNGPPAMIVVDGGNNQFGTPGAPLPRPFIAVVVDSGSNRIANVPVTFTEVEGGGTFGTASSLTVMTDSDGRAWATPTIGQAGNNAFNASFAAIQSVATFVATGKVAGRDADTRISGVVMDNQDRPIHGVSVRIEGTTIVTQTDEQGQFTIPGAPVGYVKLIIDGSTAQRSGTWPMLEFAMHTIAGADNTLEMPIHILPIDVRRGLFVDETNGGTLTLPEMPGFSLTVQPGSATFPGGGRTGTVSVTLVNVDKIPMAPGFGQQPRFIVTIQPPGVHFDPPAAITFPNVDGLAPGEVTEMYSFDHDLGQYVSIGTGSVSADGSVIRSDAGVGIIKGGWHCGGNPSGAGTSHNCPRCKRCQNGTCVTDPAQNCSCRNNKVCVSGTDTAVTGPNCGTNNAVVPGVNNLGNWPGCTPHGLFQPVVPPNPVPVTGCKRNCQAEMRVGAWSQNVNAGACGTNIDISGAADSDVTRATYCAIIQDLTPDATGRAPRTTYWSRALTERHENYHVTDWQRVLRTQWPAFETQVEAMRVPFNCTIMSTTAAVNQQRAAIDAAQATLIQNTWTAIVPGAEDRAYADGRAGYQALVNAICQRARANNWNTTNPCPVCP